MDTKKYAVFEKTAQLSSLTRAAEELQMTQSGVSHVLADLEEELGFRLMTRSRAGVKLTPEGERLLPLAREVLRREEELLALAGEIRGLAAGTVRIGTFTSVAVHWLPGMMKEFQALYPQVEFQLFNGDYHDVDRWLSEEAVDVGFVALPTELRCQVVPLYEDPLLAILPPGHPLAALTVCPVREVAREPFISLLESSAHDARRAMDRAGVKPNVKFTTKDDYAIVAMVEQGLGVSIMPELLLQGRAGNVAVRQISPAVSRTIALALPGEHAPAPATRRFAEFAAEWVKRNGAPRL